MRQESRKRPRGAEAPPARPELSSDFARRFGLVLGAGDPDAERLDVALRDDADPDILFQVQRHFSRPFELSIVSAGAFDALLRARYPAGPPGPEGGNDAADGGGGGTTIDRLIASLLGDAAHRRATDLHFEPGHTGMAVRMRVAGVLSEAFHLPPVQARVLLHRLKELGGLDPQVSTRAQDGRMAFVHEGVALPEASVATLPSRDGERLVLRLGAGEAARGELEALGMVPALARSVERLLTRQSGIILVSGPPGVGKGTTLHAMLHRLNHGTRNILTVEREGDARIAGVGQIVADPAVPGAVAESLRALLKQDPDVVMIREIADRETALLAIEAAQAGHLVLGGVAAGDAVSAIMRLRAMRVEPFLLASTLRLVLAQRVVKRLCPHCRQPIQARGSVSSLLGFDPGAIVYAPVGCESCAGTGFAGMTGVFEAVHIDEGARRLVNDGGDEALLTRHAFLRSPNLGSAARALVREGVTTPDEAVRVSRSTTPAVVR